MTNFEKYKDDIINEIKTSNLKNICCNIKDIQMKGKDFDCTGRDYESCDECAIKMIEWLGEEYKEPSPYADWQIDDKVEVSLIRGNWVRGHFAGVSENGKPMAWYDGATSWSCNSREVWNYARRAEE